VPDLKKNPAPESGHALTASILVVYGIVVWVCISGVRETARISRMMEATGEILRSRNCPEIRHTVGYTGYETHRLRYQATRVESGRAFTKILLRVWFWPTPIFPSALAKLGLPSSWARLLTLLEGRVLPVLLAKRARPVGRIHPPQPTERPLSHPGFRSDSSSLRSGSGDGRRFEPEAPVREVLEYLFPVEYYSHHQLSLSSSPGPGKKLHKPETSIGSVGSGSLSPREAGTSWKSSSTSVSSNCWL
jgi:hypothetical protein